MKAHATLQALGQSNYTVLSLDDLNKIKRYSTVSRVQVGTNTSKGTYLLMIDITQRKSILLGVLNLGVYLF
jgi:hypothetical protein